jgi:hypothetical protein
MKQFFTATLLIFLLSSAFGQIRAVTSSGDEVILNSNGSWKYANDSMQTAGKIDTIKVAFFKKPANSFLVKSNKVNCGIYLDPKKWSFEKSAADDVSEFDFTLKDKDAYAMLISEKTEIPLETMKEVALENAKDAAPDIKIVRQEYRKVNNNIVLLIQMRGSVKGIKVTYIGYYFSSPKGTVQFLTYTASSLVTEYQKDLEELLNGFVTVE